MSRLFNVQRRTDVEESTSSASRRYLLLLLVIVGVLKIAHFALSITALRTAEPSEVGRFALGVPLLAWDSAHYLTILTTGYPPAAPSIPWVAGFFPLYPLSAAPLTAIFSPQIALLLAANFASLVGFAVFYRWCLAVTSDARVSLLAGVLLASYPLAMFFSAGYSEGLFFLLTGWFLLACQQQKFWWAAAAAGLATATRPTGVALLPILFLMLLRDAPPAWWRSPLPLARYALLMLIASGGLLAFATFEYCYYGDFTAYISAQSTYGVAAAPPLTQSSTSAAPLVCEAELDRLLPSDGGLISKLASKLTSPGAWNRVFAWLSVFVALLSWPYAARRVPYPYLLLPLVIFALGYLPGMGVRITSIARFQTAALPLFLVLALLLARWPRAILGAAITGSLALQMIYVWLFTRGGWCG